MAIIGNPIILAKFNGGEEGHVVVVETADSHGGTVMSITATVVKLQQKTITPSESVQTVSPDPTYTGLSQVNVGAIDSDYVGSGVTRKAAETYSPSETQRTIAAGQYLDGAQTIGAVSSTYVGSGITRRSSSDLSVSGATVYAPAGYYEAQASKSVATGTAGVPSATKGAVNNHSVTLVPTVTNTAGYISGGTRTGTPVTVTASELVSGSQTIVQNGTVDVTDLASVDVAIPIQHYYTGSGTPASSLGENGDIYLQTGG